MPRLALAMIVRDAATELEACLASAAGAVDEIVIADTGSNDDTIAVAEAHGARVIQIPWEDDFAAARNRGLEAVEADWVLVLDADERLEPGPMAVWRSQLEHGYDAFQVTIRNYVRSLEARVWDRGATRNDKKWKPGAEYPAWIEHENVRLFRRCPELYFVGRVHESVGPRVREAGLRLGSAQGRIHHFGLARPAEAAASKNLLYRELGRRKALERPQDAQAQFELGVIEFDNFHHDAEALRCFERALRLEPKFALAWFFGGAALMRLGHAREALEFWEQARAHGYGEAKLEEWEGDAHYQLEQFEQAAASFRRAAQRRGAVPAVTSKLGLAELRAGERDKGLQRLRLAARRDPGHAENHDRLVAALVWTDDLAGAIEAQRERLRHFPGQAGGERKLEVLDRARATARAGPSPKARIGGRR
ncbi:MAG TPA: glycosyltransferase [Terriglobales bacterium]|nr:glycosyltransferase [Terriglobales bacterium]